MFELASFALDTMKRLLFFSLALLLMNLWRSNLQAGQTTSITLNLPANGLVYSAFDNTLYAVAGRGTGVLSNCLAAINPENGSINWSLPLSGEPGCLDISCDGRFVFVGYKNTNMVTRVDLNERVVGRTLSEGSSSVRRMSAVAVRRHPTEPDTVAVALGSWSSPFAQVLQIYKDGVLMSNAPPTFTGYPEFSPDGSLLYSAGYSVVVYKMLTNGFTATGVSRALESGRVRVFGDKLFCERGPVLDGRTLAKVGSLPFGSAPLAGFLALDDAAQRAYFLGTRGLQGADLVTLRWVGTVPAFLLHTVGGLVSMGTNGVAYFYTGLQVVLVKPGFLPTPASADLALEFAEPVKLLSETTGDGTGSLTVRVSYKLEVYNAGPGRATSVIVTNSYNPTAAWSHELALSQGTVTAGSSQLLWYVGEIAAGEKATAAVTLVRTLAAGNAPSAVTVGANVTASETDSDLTDNEVFGYAGSVQQIKLQANDLIVNAAGDRLLVTVPGQAGFRGNSVVVIDPTEGGIVGCVFAGSEPDEIEPTPNPVVFEVELEGAETNLVELDISTHQILRAARVPWRPNKPDIVSDELTGMTYSLRPTSDESSGTILAASDTIMGIEVAGVNLEPFWGQTRRLVRWGVDGLAFLAQSRWPQSVVFFRSPIVLPGPRTDLRVELGTEQNEGWLGTEWRATVRLLNAGPEEAINPVVELTFPTANLVFERSDFGAGLGGVVSTDGGWIRAQWQGALASGEQAELHLTFRPSAAGPFRLEAKCAYFGKDIDYVNNTARLMSQVGFRLGEKESQTLRLTTRDLVFEPMRGLFYACVPAGGPFDKDMVVAIDPCTGLICASVPASAPARMAVADDGTCIYVAVDDGRNVRRYLLPGLVADIDFEVGYEEWYGPLFAGHMQVVPHRADTVAIARIQPLTLPDQRGIGLFVNGKALPMTTQDGSWFTFDTSGATLYLVGHYFDRYIVASDGLVNVSRYDGFGVGGNLVLDGDRLFSSGGTVVDVKKDRIVGAVPGGWKVPDLANDRVYVLASSAITAVDARGFVEINAANLPQVEGNADRLWRWGQDGFAFRTDAGAIVFARTALVPNGTPAGLSMRIDLRPASEQQGGRRMTAVVHNSGPGTAHELALTLKTVGGIAFVNPRCSQGGVCGSSESPAVLRYSRGELAAGENWTIESEMREETCWRAWYVGGVVSSASPDPDLDDNFSIVFTSSPAPNPAVRDYCLPWLVRDQVYDRWHQRLVMSVADLPGVRGGCLLFMNPVTFQTDQPVVVGQSPGRLAITTDETKLFVGLDAAHEVGRVDLERRALEVSILLAPVVVAYDLQPVPGYPRAMVISRRDTTSVPGDEGVLVVDLPGGATMESADVPQVLGAGFGPGEIAGYHGTGLCAHTITEYGIFRRLCGGEVQGVTDIHTAAGRLFTDNGRVFDRDFKLVYEFPLYTYDVVTLPDAMSRRVFRLHQGNILVHNIDDYAEIGSQQTSGVWPYGALVRWGACGLAYLSGNTPYVVPTVVGLPADVDQDGLPDDWEIQNQLSPVTAGDRDLDSDGDGLTNADEFVAGTNPRDSSSFLGLRATRKGGGLELSWQTAPERRYRLQKSKDLGHGNGWVDIAEFGDEKAEVVCSIPVELQSQKCFYRVVVTK